MKRVRSLVLIEQVGTMKCKKSFITVGRIITIVLCFCGNNVIDSAYFSGTPEPDITNPGPDTANFPTSPFNLPKGRAYYENFPLTFELPDNGAPYTYSWPFLLRIGMTDFLEFRLIGQGLTHLSADKITGFSPLGIGLKAHLWGDQDWRWAPSAGIEVYVVPPIASKQLRDGTQFIINGLFDHKLSERLAFEWNLGVYGRGLLPIKKRAAYALINWSLQCKITEPLSLFFEGLFSKANYPLYPANLILGAGFISTVHKRLCIYGSYNWPVFYKRNSDLANLGFAVAF